MSLLSTILSIVQRLRHSEIQGRSEAAAHPASAITNTPAGNVAAATVQAAIDELDSEKIAVATLTTAGDLLYRTTVPARLAIGTAYQKLRVNSGATAPEWATDREVLSSARTYYVRGDGNDGNTGLADTAGGAFLTIQKAVDVISANLDIAGYTVTVHVRDGTYTGAVTLRNVVGYASPGNLVIQGNSGTPSNVVISTTSAACFTASNISSAWDLKDMRLQTTTSGNCISAVGSTVRFSGLDFGACASNHISASRLGRVEATGNYTISGGAYSHMVSDIEGIIYIAGRTITFSANCAFTYFALATRTTVQYLAANTYSVGAYTITGTRYSAATHSHVATGAGGSSYLPGDVSGVVDGTTFGLYS